MGAREALLGAKVQSEKVFIKSLGETFYVRGMTGVERDQFELSMVKRNGRKVEYKPENIRAKLVAFCCVKENGEREFSDSDAELLGQVRADVLDQLYSVAQRLSGLRDEDIDELGQGSPQPTVSSSPSSRSVNDSI